MGNILSEEQKKIDNNVSAFLGVTPNNGKNTGPTKPAHMKDDETSKTNLIQRDISSDHDIDNRQNITKKGNEFQKVVDKYLNGKDCLSCKVMATVNPLLLAGFTFYAYRNNKVTHWKPASRYAYHLFYLSAVGCFLTMSFLSLTGSYTVKGSEEDWSAYIQRDRQTMVNQIRLLYRSPPKKEEK